MAKTASAMKRAGTTSERSVSASLQRHFDKENARVADLMSKRDGSITMDNGQILEKDTLKGMMMNLRDVKANGTLYEDFAYDILYTDGKQAHYTGGDDTSKMKLTGIQAVIEDNGSTLMYAGKGVKIENLNQTEAFAKMTRYGTSKYEDDWRMDFE